MSNLNFKESCLNLSDARAVQSKLVTRTPCLDSRFENHIAVLCREAITFSGFYDCLYFKAPNELALENGIGSTISIANFG